MLEGLGEAELRSRTGAPLTFAAGLPAASGAADRTAGRGPRVNFAEVNGTALRFDLSGSGASTLVLIHEMGGTIESWDAVAPLLSAKRRILRYDTRGAGLSQKVRGTLTIDTMVDDLIALLDMLGITGQSRSPALPSAAPLRCMLRCAFPSGSQPWSSAARPSGSRLIAVQRC